MNWHEELLIRSIPSASEEAIKKLMHIVIESASPTEMVYAIIKVYNYAKTEESKNNLKNNLDGLFYFGEVG